MDTAFTGRRNVQSVMKIVAQLLAVPFFWFGGPWVTTAVMKSVNLATIFTAYIYSLAVTFLLIIIFPTLNLVVSIQVVADPRRVAGAVGSTSSSACIVREW